MKMKNILIFGSGGHASVVIDIAQQEKKYEIIGIIDEPRITMRSLAYPSLVTFQALRR